MAGIPAYFIPFLAPLIASLPALTSKMESSMFPVNVTPILLSVSVNTGLCLPPPSSLHFLLLLLWASCDIDQRRCSAARGTRSRPDSCLLDLTLAVSLSMLPSLSFIRYKHYFCNSDPLKNWYSLCLSIKRPFGVIFLKRSSRHFHLKSLSHSYKRKGGNSYRGREACIKRF